MNIKKLTDKELLDLINSTNNTELLNDLEGEYIIRQCNNDENYWVINKEDIDDEIDKAINETWRGS
jgi:hypothetical protein